MKLFLCQKQPGRTHSWRMMRRGGLTRSRQGPQDAPSPASPAPDSDAHGFQVRGPLPKNVGHVVHQAGSHRRQCCIARLYQACRAQSPDFL